MSSSPVKAIVSSSSSTKKPAFSSALACSFCTGMFPFLKEASSFLRSTRSDLISFSSCSILVSISEDSFETKDLLSVPVFSVPGDTRSFSSALRSSKCSSTDTDSLSGTSISSCSGSSSGSSSSISGNSSIRSGSFSSLSADGNVSELPIPDKSPSGISSFTSPLPREGSSELVSESACSGSVVSSSGSSISSRLSISKSGSSRSGKDS